MCNDEWPMNIINVIQYCINYYYGMIVLMKRLTIVCESQYCVWPINVVCVLLRLLKYYYYYYYWKTDSEGTNEWKYYWQTIEDSIIIIIEGVLKTRQCVNEANEGPILKLLLLLLILIDQTMKVDVLLSQWLLMKVCIIIVWKIMTMIIESYYY